MAFVEPGDRVLIAGDDAIEQRDVITQGANVLGLLWHRHKGPRDGNTAAAWKNPIRAGGP